MVGCWQGKPRVLGEKPVPVPPCPSQNSYGLAWDWTRAIAVRIGWLTALAMARPRRIVSGAGVSSPVTHRYWGAHPASNAMGTRGDFLWGKVAGEPITRVYLMPRWRMSGGSSTSPYASMTYTRTAVLNLLHFIPVSTTFRQTSILSPPKTSRMRMLLLSEDVCLGLIVRYIACLLSLFS